MSLPDRTRAALERAAAAAERRKGAESPPPTAAPTAPSSAPPVVPAPEPEKVAAAPAPEPEKVAAVPAPEPEKVVAAPFGVGEEVMALWREDGLWYRARVDRVETTKCDVLFLEYGNGQTDTPVDHVLTLAEFELQQKKGASEQAAVAVVEEPDKAATVTKTAEETVSEASKTEDEGDDETWVVSSSPPSRGPGGSGSGGRLVGKNADGTPIYMSASDEARLRQLQKQDKKDRAKGLLSKLGKKEKKEKKSPVVTVEPVSPWRHSPPASPPPPSAPPATQTPPPPLPPPKSPRRQPPPPPPPPVEETLAELPPLPPTTSGGDLAAAGHAFVVLSDLRSLACDAWCVHAKKKNFVPEAAYFRSKTAKPQNYAGIVGAGGLKYFGLKSSVARAPGWPDDDRPSPYVVVMACDELEAGLLAPVRQFLELATLEVAAPPAHGRSKALLALPLVSDGLDPGLVARALLPVLIAHARNRNVDVALVTSDAVAFAAAQSARVALAEAFASVGSFRSVGDDLARRCLQRMALVVGLGEEQLADDALRQLHPLDQLRLLRSRSGTKQPAWRLLDVVMGSLPVDRVIVSSQDDRCVDVMQRDRRIVLRIDPLHAGTRDTLRGFVLGAALTSHHVLFVGCPAMVVDDVRAALGSDVRSGWGTVLGREGARALWPADVAGVAVPTTYELELLLDYVCARSIGTAIAIPTEK